MTAFQTQRREEEWLNKLPEPYLSCSAWRYGRRHLLITEAKQAEEGFFFFFLSLFHRCLFLLGHI